MRIGLHAALLIASMMICVGVAHAQNPSGNATGVEALRAQLLDVEAKEAELQAREKQLDEDLRPENIERSLALTGSTRPEELREQRRRQLEAEKARVRAQLEQLATSHARLETTIAAAEAAVASRPDAATTTATTTLITNANIAPASRTVRGRPRTRTRPKRSVRHRRRSFPRRRR